MNRWRKVVHWDECDELDNCPKCRIDFADCPCPGPTQDDLYEYKWDAKGVLWARPHPTFHEPPPAGPCVKQTVIATVVATSGRRFVATNGIANAQTTCPRAGLPTGQGYELCRDICAQPYHAEIGALRLAGGEAVGATLYLEGHTYACADCVTAAHAHGIARIVIGKPE